MVPFARVAMWKAVEPLLTDRAARTTMAQRARAFGRPDAAERLADVVLAAAGRR